MKNEFNDTSGPAFPGGTHKMYDEEGNVISFGMTLRDYFAGQALMSLPHLRAHDTLLDNITFEQHVARNAYKLADAMIEQRGSGAT